VVRHDKLGARANQRGGDRIALLDSDEPGEALFTFLGSMVLRWGACDRGLVDALPGYEIDVESAAPDADQALRALLGELLRAA
jgi:hypothetical protein